MVFEKAINAKSYLLWSLGKAITTALTWAELRHWLANNAAAWLMASSFAEVLTRAKPCWNAAFDMGTVQFWATASKVKLENRSVKNRNLIVWMFGL